VALRRNVRARSRQGVRAVVSSVAGCVVAYELAGLLFGASALAGNQTAPGVFPSTPLGPGRELTSHISVEPGNKPLTPYLEVLDLNDACRNGCTPGVAKLSDLLQITSIAPDGTLWSRPLSALTSITALTGGAITPSDAPRTYTVMARLPLNASNASEGTSTSFEFQWGLMDAQGHAVTRVLGDSFRSRSGLAGHELPFTGSDVVLELAVMGSLLALGLMLLRVARRRHASTRC
jgi:hypothetical protein